MILQSDSWRILMNRFVAGIDRNQTTFLPECRDDFIDESNPVRVIDVFVEALNLGELGFDGVDPAVTRRPSYHPSILLKLYIYGYLNRVQSNRRLEREAGRNAVGPANARSQDHCRLPQGQWTCAPQSVCTVC
jgi:transposase